MGLSLLFYHQSRMPISGILTNTSFLWFQASYMAMTQNDSRYVSHFWTGKYGHIFVYYLTICKVQLLRPSKNLVCQLGSDTMFNLAKFTPLKINLEHNHGGLEDHFPF